MNILITNVFGDLNKGDKALFETLYHIIKSKNSNANISAVARFYEDFDLDVNIIEQPTKLNSRNIFYRVFYYIFVIVYMELSLRIGISFSSRFQEYLDAVRESDIVISCPGGFLEDSNLSYLLGLLQMHHAQIRGKKCIIAPQSIGPIKSKIGRFFLKKILSGFDHIFVRESFSYKFLIDLGVNENLITKTTDVALHSSKFHSFQILKREEDLHLSTVVRWNFPHMESVDYQINNYIWTLNNYYKYLHQKYGFRTLIYDQVSVDKQFSDLLDYDKSYLKKYKIEDFKQTISEISKAKLFTGSRFHSCVFSMMANTPFIAIAYLPKTSGILRDLNLDSNCLDINNIKLEELIEKADYILENYEHEMELLKGISNNLDTKFEDYIEDTVQESIL